MKRKSKKNELPALSTLSPVMPDPAGGISHFNNAMGTSDGGQAMGESIDANDIEYVYADEIENDDWEVIPDDLIRDNLSEKAYIIYDKFSSEDFSQAMINSDGYCRMGGNYDEAYFRTFDDFLKSCEYTAEQWSDEDIIELMNESMNNKKLNEGRWNHELSNGPALRQAINNDDFVEVINQIRIAYKEMLDKGLIDEYDFESWTEDFDLYGDFTDWEDPEDTVNYELDNLYDACDNLGIWIPLHESAKVQPKPIKKSNKLIKEKKEELARYNIDAIKQDVVDATLNFMQSIGYDEDMAAAYTAFDFEEEPDRIQIEVRAELSYDEMIKLSEKLDEVIFKYSDSAYFEPETAGILSCVIWKKSTLGESIKGLERRIFNETGDDFNLDCLYEATQHNLSTRDKSTLQDIIRKSKTAEDVDKYLSGLLDEE